MKQQLVSIAWNIKQKVTASLTLPRGSKICQLASPKFCFWRYISFFYVLVVCPSQKVPILVLSLVLVFLIVRFY